MTTGEVDWSLSGTARVCRFCGDPNADFIDSIGRSECADTADCQRREILSGRIPHPAEYPKGPVRDPDGPICRCGQRVFDPIHRDGWAASVRAERDARLRLPPLRVGRAIAEPVHQPVGVSQSEPRLTVGSIVDIPDYGEQRFVVGRALEGGMGIVYQLNAVSAPIAPVALKTFKETVDAARFDSEVAAWVGLAGHPNIASVLWYGRWRNAPAVISPWYPGTLNHEYVRNLDDDAAARLFSGVVAGLEHAYRVGGLFHRDIKPSNILLAESGEPCLADFGIATLAQETSDLGQEPVGSLRRARTTAGVAGSPAYMAPELFAGAEPSIATELFALGVTLYELLTGEHPFAGVETRYQLTRALRREPLDRLGQARARRFAPLVEALVSIDPRARPSGYDAVRSELKSRASGTAAARPHDAVIAEALFLRKQGESAQAMALLTDALAENETDPALLNAIAVTSTQDPMVARAALERATVLLRATGGLRDGMTYLDPMVNLARLRIGERAFGDAAELLSEGEEWSRGSLVEQHYLEFGWLDLFEGRFVQAADRLDGMLQHRQAATVDPLHWLLLAAMLAGRPQLHADRIAVGLMLFRDSVVYATVAAVLMNWLGDSVAASLWSSVDDDARVRAVALVREAGEDPADLGPPAGAPIQQLVLRSIDWVWTGGRHSSTGRH